MPGQYLEPHQSRSDPLSVYDLTLARAIEAIFARGAHDLPGLLEGLNAANVVSPDGQPWTESSLTVHLRYLGA